MPFWDKRAQWFGKVASEIAKNRDDIKQDLKNLGNTMRALDTLTNRLLTLGETILYVKDKTIPIEDRVERMDDVITMVGMAYGTAAVNALWAELYTSWSGLMQYWLAFNSMKYEFENVVVEVEQLQAVKKEQRQANGMVTFVDSMDWVQSVMHPKAALIAYLKDRESGAAQTFRIKDAKPRLPTGQKESPDEIETRQFLEEFGEIAMIRTGLVVLNYVWFPSHIPNDTTLVIHTPPAIAQVAPKQTEPGLAADFYERTPKDKIK